MSPVPAKRMAMRRTRRLFLVIAEAVFLLTAAWIAVVLVVDESLVTPASSAPGRALVIGSGLVLLIAAASWWTFRRLLRYYSRPEARATAIAFGFFMPVPLAAGLVLGQVVGGYTAKFFGDHFAFAGAVAGLVMIVTLMSFIASAFVIWLVRRSPPVGYPATPGNGESDRTVS